MSKSLPALTYTEVNNTQVPPVTLLGAHGLIAESLMGPADKPYKITSVQDFLDKFGSFGAASPYFAQIRRALARGVTLYFQRLLPTAAGVATAALDTSLVTVSAKDDGAWANGTVKVAYTPVTGGKNMLVVTYSGNPNRNETWSAASIAALIALVNAGSSLISMAGADGFTEPADSHAAPVALAGGLDGAFVSAATRDAAVVTLFPNFNNITDITTLSVMGSNTSAHYASLNAYVSARQDILGLMELDPTSTPNTAATFAATLAATPSQYMALYYSSLLSAFSPEEGKVVAGGCLADVIAVYAASDTISGNVYKAPAGSRRGLIPNVQTFSTNLLAAANKIVANQLVATGVNIVGSDRAFGPVVWGALTFFNSGTAFDSINVRREMTSLHQQLAPIFRSELFQPMDPVTWRDAYGKAKQVLDGLVSDEAIYTGYIYVGDQESSVISDAKYNKAADLANGIYKVKITVVPVGYIDQITLEMDADNLTTLFSTNQTV